MQSPLADESREPMTIRPVAPGWLIAVVALMSIGGGVFAARSLRTVGRTVVVGRLEAETFTLEAIDVVVEETLVRVGDDVEAGTPLVRVRANGEDSESRERRVAALRAKADGLRSQAALMVADRTAALDASIHGLQREVARLRGEQFAAELERVAWQDALEGDSGEPPLIATASLTKKSPVEDRYRMMVAFERASTLAETREEECRLCESRLEALKKERAVIAETIRDALSLPTLEGDLALAVKAAAACPLGACEEVVASCHGRVLSIAAAGEIADGTVAVLGDTRSRRIVAAVPTPVAVETAEGETVSLVFPGGARLEGRIAHVSPDANDADTVSVTIVPSGARWPDCPVGCGVRIEFE